ncbi:hypothetical protein ES703_36810 [subsurface metagenome]
MADRSLVISSSLQSVDLVSEFAVAFQIDTQKNTVTEYKFYVIGTGDQIEVRKVVARPVNDTLFDPSTDLSDEDFLERYEVSSEGG